VKRNFAIVSKKAVTIVFFASFASSCSNMLVRRENVSQQNAPLESRPSVVAKEQYDELARKYQELLDKVKNQNINIQAQVPVAPILEEKTKEQVKPEIAAQTNIDPSELVNHIDQAIPDSKSAEVVDLALENKTDKKMGPVVPNAIAIKEVNLTDDIDEQISKIHEVEDLVKVNKFENALAILKELENSKEKQIVVRSKVMLGDLLFNQGEFDLAMQVYEEVVKKYAFSGLVLKALGKLVVCSEKLKRPEKQAKYYSLLHDFFEAA
jgi:predicted negative regulator of RcsB-dependent stress response